MNSLVDTNILVLHAIGIYRPRLLNKVTFGLLEDPMEEWRRTNAFLTALRGSTTYVLLGEFEGVLKSRANFSGAEIRKLLERYGQVLGRLQFVDLTSNQILSSSALEFGISDASVFEAARSHGLAVLTRDDRLRNFCKGNGVRVAPFYEWLFGS